MSSENVQGNWVRWLTPVIEVFMKLRKEDGGMFKVSLSYIANLCLTKKTKQKPSFFVLNLNRLTKL